MVKLEKRFPLLMVIGSPLVVLTIVSAILLPDTLAVKYLAVIQSILAFVLVMATVEYAKSTEDLVYESVRNREAESAREEERRRLEEEKEKAKKNQFMDVLLAEFIENQSLLYDLKEGLEKLEIRNWFNLKTILLQLKDDGFLAFRNQGGFQYISDCKCRDSSLYDAIAKYYNNQYKFNQKIAVNMEVGEEEEHRSADISMTYDWVPFIKNIQDRINDLMDENNNLQKAITDCKDHSASTKAER